MKTELPLTNSISVNGSDRLRTRALCQDTPHLEIQQLSLSNLDELVELEIKAWGPDMAAGRAMLKTRLEIFPEGAFGARSNDVLVGYTNAMMIKKEEWEKNFSWSEITNNGFIKGTHDPKGDCLYGVSLSTLPTASKDVAVKLVKGAARLAVRKALKGILFGTRVPSYHKYKDEMSIDEYIAKKTKTGRYLDPELTFYSGISASFIRPIHNYFEDPDSLNYGVLALIKNPIYEFQQADLPFFIKSLKINFS